MSDIIIGETEPLEAQFTALGLPILNAVGVIFLRRNDDDTYFNGATHQATRVSIAMTEVSEAQAAGFFRYNFNTTGIAAGVYTVEVQDTSGNSDNPQAPFSIKLIENTVIDNQVSIESKIDVIGGITASIKTSTDNLPNDPTSEAAATSNKAATFTKIEVENEDSQAAVMGRSFYDKISSIETLYKKNQPTVVHKTFSLKDKNGDPAKENPVFEKEPI